MKGFVPTPPELVDSMVRKLMRATRVTAATTLLDPGCGDGEFIAGILRWCDSNDHPVPRILGIEQHPFRAARARERFRSISQVSIVTADFLVPRSDRFDLIIGNPPYVSLGNLSVEERRAYRDRYQTARGRFDLYMLFFEQALELLKPDGRLVFVTPEKFTYVDSARSLRRLMLSRSVQELHFVDESSFEGFVTYPIVTTIGAEQGDAETSVILRSGDTYNVKLKGDRSWQPIILDDASSQAGPTLSDACIRISCGVATGADAAFIVLDTELTSGLRRFAHPTVSGRQLGGSSVRNTRSYMLVPYDRDGRLLPESKLGALGGFLAAPERKALLSARTCVPRKPWYAFHDNVPLQEILRPKILCKDIAPAPRFTADENGTIVPRHSAYYIVPQDPAVLPNLLEYLNSEVASRWLVANCQRAANGFVRLQSGVLKRLPIPTSLLTSARPQNEFGLETFAISA